MCVEACPYLPQSNIKITAKQILFLRQQRNIAYFEKTLAYAQQLWCSGFPAKAILQINQALSCCDSDVSLRNTLHQPYHALAWFLQNRQQQADAFWGNPRRHFQHLASRMVAPNRELRQWRAWACHYISKKLLPAECFPADLQQIVRENLAEPVLNEIQQQLETLSLQEDHQAFNAALKTFDLSIQRTDTSLEFPNITLAEIPSLIQLAHIIWPAVYNSMIGNEQVVYMLQTFYHPDELRRQMQQRGMRYHWLQHHHQRFGFLAWESDISRGSAFLHKLYLHPEHSGKGFGQQALHWISQKCRSLDLQSLQLRVNRHNQIAIQAYLRNGFIIQQAICSNIGNDFVMDDYLLTKKLI